MAEASLDTIRSQHLRCILEMARNRTSSVSRANPTTHCDGLRWHASVATTQLYARVVNADLEDAADALPILGQHSGPVEKPAPASPEGVRNAAK